jgi:two-component system cell cycle sensor histidine kinase/response regulator CckA
MTASHHDSERGEERPVFDRTDQAARAGGVGWVLAVAVVLVAAAAGLFYLGKGQSERYVFILLALLATVGTFCLFALASGILRIGVRESGNAIIKAIAGNAADAIVVTEPGGRVIYANSAYLDLTGASDAGDVRPIERAFIGNPDVSEAIYRLLNAAREGKRLQEEVRIGGAAGEVGRWLRLRVRPLGGEGKHAKDTVWSVADISRERERHENVFQELQHAVDYLDHAPAGFFSVDAGGAVVYLNATLAGWLDHDLASVGSGGLKIDDIVAGDGAALLTSRTAGPGEVRTDRIDLDLKTRTGKPVPVRLVHKVAYGADGEPGASRTLVLTHSRDESGASTRRDVDVRFMRFFHNTPMAIATVDRTGRVARENPRFASMFAGQLGEHRSILGVVAEANRAALEGAIRKAAEGQSDIAPVEAALAGSGERWAAFFVLAVEEGDGEAAIVYVLETTKQRELEDHLKQQQKMEAVGKMAGGIAHDFNNVLSAIMMATDFLLNAHKPTDPSFQDIMQIKQNANRAAALVRQLLAFSRKQTLRPQVLDLNETLSDTNILLKRLVGEKVSLEMQPGRDLWPVLVDLSQFEQVIVNLAVNARDAMPDGGKLTLHTANVAADESVKFGYKGMPQADYVLVEVDDTGSGIPEAIIDKIFEPFFSTKDVHKGTGLGLSTVYGIVKQTGGFIYVDSQPGRTTFRIFLPRHVPGEQPVRHLPNAEAPAIAQALSAAEEAERAAKADLTGHGTILLVEDEDGLRALNARGLVSRGYTVLEAANGVEAVELMDEHGGSIDLVVSDVVMPEMDGPALLKELRRRDPRIKFIFVSGYAEDAFAKSVPDGAMPDFLAKPFTLKQLVAAVKQAMTS